MSTDQWPEAKLRRSSRSREGRAVASGFCLAIGLLLISATGAGALDQPAPIRLLAGQPTTPDLQLSSPTRLAAGPLPGTLVVADHRQRAVLLLDSTDFSTQLQIGLDGRPSAVATLQSWIYIADEATGKVRAYNTAGKQLFELEGTVGRPADIATSKDQRLLFVVDGAAAEVKVFRDRGSFLYSFGTGDPTGEALLHPTGIAYDPDRREVLVSDFGDPVAGIPPRVQIYSELGEYRATLSEADQESDFRFSRPQGLAVAGNRIFLVDSLLGKVLVFDRDTLRGQGALGSYGSEEGHLLLPLDVTWEPSTNRVFVTSNRTARIEVFDDGGTP